ncbi:MAG: 1-acyl-sn-glycerol-3-phosphate acyltransferase [Candidatus Pacebacteria bacterium]|nr:1-acyl-sn-glycerol-3-phosphate acyltransferase [Candidatus Paceibacterota bacterium]
MKINSLAWKIYKLIFLDFWHHQFFHSKIRPQDSDLNGDQLDEYLKDLGLLVKGIDINDGKEVIFTDDHPTTLFYADHPSTLDALYFYTLLRHVKPYFVSFIHNKLHFKFLGRKMIPVAAYFKSQQLSPLGMKLRFARRIEDMDEVQAREMNSQVVPIAVEKLSRGESVIIFPSGGWGEWQDGIGFIISQFHQKYPNKELIIQPLKMKSFGEFHSVIHGFLRMLGIKTTAVVQILVGHRFLLSKLSKEVIFQTENEKQRAKSIRTFLKKTYNLL